MTYPAIHAQLEIAEESARNTRSYLLAALSLAKARRCPLSYRAALNKAYNDAQSLWLHVGNTAPLFDQPVVPPRD